MASYKILWKAAATRELRRIDRSVVPRIVQAVKSLAEDPRPAGSRKLVGTEQSYRLRVGTYRVVYTITDDILLIEIIRVRHRKDAYR